MLSNLRRFFRERGTYKEPFNEYLFFGKVEFRTVHTTFFMKDYEIRSFLYLFVKEEVREQEKELERLKEISRELLTLPPDHYLSSFCTLALKGRGTAYSSKTLWLGFKGRVEWGVLMVNGAKVEGPPQMEGIARFLTSLCFKD
ncbi:hypothetical protein [Thermovibrio sp.]